MDGLYRTLDGHFRASDDLVGDFRVMLFYVKRWDDLLNSRRRSFQPLK